MKKKLSAQTCERIATGIEYVYKAMFRREGDEMGVMPNSIVFQSHEPPDGFACRRAAAQHIQDRFGDGVVLDDVVLVSGRIAFGLA